MLTLKTKARATGPGFMQKHTAEPGRSPGPAQRHGRSGDLLEHLGHAFLDRLGGLGRDLLRQRSELLGLRGHRLELLARMRGRQFDHLGEDFTVISSLAKSNAALVLARAASITLRP